MFICFAVGAVFIEIYQKQLNTYINSFEMKLHLFLQYISQISNYFFTISRKKYFYKVKISIKFMGNKKGIFSCLIESIICYSSLSFR